MERLRKIIGERLGNGGVSSINIKTIVYLLAAGVGLLFVLVILQYQQWHVMVRSHNLEVFYKSLTCDDLPLAGDSSVAKCEQAIGRYVLPERGMFTR